MNISKATISSREKTFLFLFAVIWTANPVLDLLRGAFLHLPGLSFVSDYVAPVLVITSIVLAFPYLFTRIKLKDVLFILGISILYLLHFLIYKENREVLNFYAFSFLCIVLPQYLIGTIFDFKKFFRYVVILSRVVIILQFFYVFVYGYGARKAAEVSDSMTQAYAILPHLLLAIYIVFKEKKMLDVLFMIAGLIQLFAFGNRGAMVALIVFLLLMVFQLHSSQLSRMRKFSIAAFFGVSYLFLDKLAIFLEGVILKMGMSARVFTRTLEGTFFEDNNRIEGIWNPLLKIIIDAPFTGYGIGGDRVVGEILYAHNIVLELIISFGIVIGVIVFLTICIHLFRGVRLCSDDYTKSIILILTCSSFLPLFVSGTYLTAFSFFFLLGVCTRSIRNKKSITSKKQEDIYLSYTTKAVPDQK